MRDRVSRWQKWVGWLCVSGRGVRASGKDKVQLPQILSRNNYCLLFLGTIGCDLDRCMSVVWDYFFFFVTHSTYNFPVVIVSRPPFSAVLDPEQLLPLLHPSVEGSLVLLPLADWRASPQVLEGLKLMLCTGLQLCSNGAAHFGNGCVKIFAKYVWSTVWRGYRREPYSPKPPCSVSPFFPQTFCLQQPNWRFWRQVTFTVQSWFVSQAASCCKLTDTLLSFGEKKIDFSVMHIHEAVLWLLWQPHQWLSRSVCWTSVSSSHIEPLNILHSLPLFSSSPPPPSQWTI